MNIEKHGVVPKNELNTEHFKCENCGCEFYADFDEYYIEKGSDFPRNNYDISSSVYVYKVTVTDNYICSCLNPEQRWSAEKTPSSSLMMKKAQSFDAKTADILNKKIVM